MGEIVLNHNDAIDDIDAIADGRCNVYMHRA